MFSRLSAFRIEDKKLHLYQEGVKLKSVSNTFNLQILINILCNIIGSMRDV